MEGGCFIRQENSVRKTNANSEAWEQSRGRGVTRERQRPVGVASSQRVAVTSEKKDKARFEVSLSVGGCVYV